MKMRRPWRAAISSIRSGMIGPEEISTTPRPGAPIAPTSASNSRDVADRRRHRHAAIARVVQRIGRAEPDRALVHRFRNQPLHLGHLSGGRLLAHRGVVAHHGGAHRRMSDQYAEVHVGAAPPQHAHVFGEGLELPIGPGAQRVEVHALDHRQVAQDQIAHRRRRRHDAEAAIAHDCGRDPERRRGRQGRVPGDLRVVMRVQVDDARHQGQARRHRPSRRHPCRDCRSRRCGHP